MTMMIPYWRSIVNPVKPIHIPEYCSRCRGEFSTKRRYNSFSLSENNHRPNNDISSLTSREGDISKCKPGELLPANQSFVFENTEKGRKQSSRDKPDSSDFYEPNIGDVVVGAVIFSNDKKIDLQIGSEFLALLPIKEFQFHHGFAGTGFYKLRSTNCAFPITESTLPVQGRMMVVQDRSINTGWVHPGLVLKAEVTGKTLVDSKAIVSCRIPAQRLAWHRLKQLMGLGEAIQVEIILWNNGGLISYVEGLRTFLPRCELLQKPKSVTVLKSYVRRTIMVSIVKVDEEESNVIISEVKAWVKKNLKFGTVHDVTVTKVYPCAMQVEVINTSVRGYVHISNISSKAGVTSVSDIFLEGDKTKVIVRGMDQEQILFSLAEHQDLE